MADVIVRAGDTLYGIARQHHIRYWPNLYFATGNEQFRQTRPNPSAIRPGDRLVIPDRTAIQPMERRPKVVYTDIPLFAQAPETCWRATAKMLFCRRRRGDRNAEATFNRMIGRHYVEKTDGLAAADWRNFYVRLLHMKEARIVSQNDLHRIVATKGPAVMMITGSDAGHAVLIAGYDILQGRWFVINPASGIQLDFEADEIVVGGSSSSSSRQGPARLTGYRAGAATYENMGRWIWILDTSIDARVYYFD